MKEFMIRPSDLFLIIRTHQKVILTVFLLTYALVMGLFLILPKSYQTTATVHVGVNYFQNPLISDLVSQTYDPGELRSERESLIKVSLGVDFAIAMGKKFNLFNTDANDSSRVQNIEAFLKQLDVSSASKTQFKIKFKGRTPEVSIGVIQGAIDSIREHMYINRVQMLEELEAVLGSEITEAADGKGGISSMGVPLKGPRAEAAKEQLRAQIGLLERRLEGMLHSYKENHPSVIAIKSQIAQLKAYERKGILAPHLSKGSIFKDKGFSLSELTIKDDLKKQKHLVNISLQMERKDPTMASYLSIVEEPVMPKKPIFPKIRLFLLFALGASVMCAALATALLEFASRTLVVPTEVAQRLKIEQLGNLKISWIGREDS